MKLNFKTDENGNIHWIPFGRSRKAKQTVRQYRLLGKELIRLGATKAQARHEMITLAKEFAPIDKFNRRQYTLDAYSEVSGTLLVDLIHEAQDHAGQEFTYHIASCVISELIKMHDEKDQEDKVLQKEVMVF